MVVTKDATSTTTATVVLLVTSPPPPPARRRHNAPSARRPGPLSPRVRWKPYTENRSDRQNDEPNGRRPLRDRSSRIRRRKASVISTQNDQLAARDARQHGEAMGLRTALQQKTIFATPKQRPKSRRQGRRRRPSAEKPQLFQQESVDRPH